MIDSSVSRYRCNARFVSAVIAQERIVPPSAEIPMESTSGDIKKLTFSQSLEKNFLANGRRRAVRQNKEAQQ